jgi:hypothetical protein
LATTFSKLNNLNWFPATAIPGGLICLAIVYPNRHFEVLSGDQLCLNGVGVHLRDALRQRTSKPGKQVREPWCLLSTRWGGLGYRGGGGVSAILEEGA